MLKKNTEITKTNQRMKSPRVHNNSVKTKLLRMKWFGEKLAMLLVDRTLLMSTPHWSHEPDIYVRPKKDTTIVEEIVMLCRLYDVNLNSPLDRLHYLRGKIQS